MNSYDLSRKWFDYCFENPEKVKPNHTALYFFAIEHCNRLGWKEKFGLPTEMAKDAIGVKSWHTYISTFNDLIEFGFFKLIERSKNQYSSNIIALINFDKALDKALDKAMTKHASKQQQSTYQSIDSIIKQLNKETLNNKHVDSLKKIIEKYFEENSKEFDFKKSLIYLGIEKQIVEDWLKVRKTKKAVNTLIAFTAIKNEIEKSGLSANECIKIAVEKSWSGFNSDWIKKEQDKFINNGTKEISTITPKSTFLRDR